MKYNKYLYCEECESFPDEIIEIYDDKYVEYRRFDALSGEYELDDTNINDLEFQQVCKSCGRKLVERHLDKENE